MELLIYMKIQYALVRSNPLLLVTWKITHVVALHILTSCLYIPALVCWLF